MIPTAWDYFEQSTARAVARRPEPFRASTLEFLRQVHPDDDGFLELRAFQKGETAVRAFIALPLTDARLAEVQAFVLAHGLRRNIYHAIATRRTEHSGGLHGVDTTIRIKRALAWLQYQPAAIEGRASGIGQVA